MKKAEINKKRSRDERFEGEKVEKPEKERSAMDETVVRYLQMVLGWIEKREVFAEEIVELMMRQHSMGKRKSKSYAGKVPATSRDGKKT